MIKTTSLELSKQMKELGFPQKDCGNYWIEPEDKTSHQLFPYDWQIVTKDGSAWTLQDEADSDNKTWHPIYAAPTAEEVLEQLPAEIRVEQSVVKTGSFRINKHVDGKYEVLYHTPSGMSIWSGDFEWRGDSLAEAAGKMWVYLKEQGYSNQNNGITENAIPKKTEEMEITIKV